MTKRILITGMNKLQCTRNFHLNQQLKVVPSQYSLYNCLYDMGYDIVQRQVEIGESLDDFDEVICYIAGPRQFAAVSLYNGLWAIHKRPDCVLAFDDWQVPDLYKGLLNCQKTENLTAEFILNNNKKTIDDINPNLDRYLEAVNKVCNKDNRMLISAFDTSHCKGDGYGPHLLFDEIEYPSELITVYNPNPFHRNRKPGNYAHTGLEAPDYVDLSPTNLFADDDEITRPKKRRQFNFASLVQSKTQKWLKSQGFLINKDDDEQGMIGDWKVDMYGSKAESQKRLTEDQMCEVFDKDWGCLMPGYSHAGSGWWRARPLQCADAGSIIIGEKKELEVYYGQDFKYIDLKAKDMIQLSSNELNEIARAQRDALYKLHPLDESVQHEQIKKVFR